MNDSTISGLRQNHGLHRVDMEDDDGFLRAGPVVRAVTVLLYVISGALSFVFCWALWANRELIAQAVRDFL